MLILTGMTAMGFLAAALFFWRFWRRTHDMLFVAFSAAFVLFAVNQLAIGLSFVPREDEYLLYLTRLVAFGLLIVAIVMKNFGNASGKS
jgi:hypothetical protein